MGFYISNCEKMNYKGMNLFI